MTNTFLMHSFSDFPQCRAGIYKASMPTRPRTPATLAPMMAVGTAAAPVEVEVDVTAIAAEEDEVIVDLPVLVEDLVVEAEVELPNLTVTEVVVLPEEPVVRTTLQLD